MINQLLVFIDQHSFGGCAARINPQEAVTFLLADIKQLDRMIVVPGHKDLPAPARWRTRAGCG